MNILFKEHHIIGYKARTIETAKADVTIAIAKDYATAGERCTVNCVTNHRKTYIAHKYDYILDRTYLTRLESLMCNHISKNVNVIIGTLNIAGNGIYSLREEQSKVDEKVYTLLTGLFHYLKQKPTAIISGGQTGIDEAGLKAAVKLDIPAICIAPKGWVFRDINGKDISDEQLFKKRFI